MAQQRNAIELIEQALVYKFPKRPWRELEVMFGLTEWKQTRFYQEVSAEGRQEGRQEGGQLKQREIALKFLGLGLSIELVAEGTGLSVEQVQQLQQQSNQSSQN